MAQSIQSHLTIESQGPADNPTLFLVDPATGSRARLGKIVTSGGAVTASLARDFMLGNDERIILSDDSTSPARIWAILDTRESTFALAERSTTPETPASGYGLVFFKTDGSMHFLNAAGTDFDITALAAGGDITSVIAGAGLTGGATSGAATLDVGAGTGLVANANDVALATIADDRIFANISGGAAAPSANTLSDILDAILGTTQGVIIYRNASGWTALAPGTAGAYLRTAGAAADPAWSTLILPNAATANRVVYASATNTYGESANLTFDGSVLTVTGNLTASGFTGLGTSVNTARILNIQKTFSNPTATNYGLFSAPTTTFTANNANIVIGIQSQSIVNQGGFNGTATRGVQGGNFLADASGASGTMTGAAGIISNARNTGAGTLTNLYGIYVPAGINSGGGAVTNAYGLFLEAQTVGGTINRSLHCAGAALILGAAAVGSGTPGTASGAGDLYVTDALEVDGAAALDGNVQVGGDVEINGGFRVAGAIEDFKQSFFFFRAAAFDSTPGSSQSLHAYNDGTNNSTIWPVETAGSVVRVTILFVVDRVDTAGTITANVQINASTIFTVTSGSISGTGTVVLEGSQARGTDTFSDDDTIGMSLVYGTFDGQVSALRGYVTVIFND